MRIKKVFSAIALFALAMFVQAAVAQSVVPTTDIPYYPTGVGPAISGSVTTGNLPEKALKFIGKYFPESVITDIDEEYDTRTFDVDLADGTDLEFDSKGEWLEVDAGRGSLTATLVQSLLPDRAFKELGRLSLTSRVETLKRSDKGYKVELRDTNLDDLRFDREGNIISIGM